MNIPSEILGVSSTAVFIVGVIVAGIAYFVPEIVFQTRLYVRALITRQSVRLAADQLSLIKLFAAEAVKAAEQFYKKQQVQDAISAKRAYAIKSLQKLLDSRGLGFLPVEELAIHLEAALNEGVHKQLP